MIEGSDSGNGWQGASPPLPPRAEPEGEGGHAPTDMTREDEFEVSGALPTRWEEKAHPYETSVIIGKKRPRCFPGLLISFATLPCLRAHEASLQTPTARCRDRVRQKSPAPLFPRSYLGNL